jgi:UbiD family decarboxylase
MSNFGVLDTRFRSALDRMTAQGRLQAYTAPIDPHLEVAAMMKALDGGPALLFTEPPSRSPRRRGSRAARSSRSRSTRRPCPSIRR